VKVSDLINYDKQLMEAFIGSQAAQNFVNRMKSRSSIVGRRGQVMMVAKERELLSMVAKIEAKVHELIDEWQSSGEANVSSDTAELLHSRSRLIAFMLLNDMVEKIGGRI